MAETTADTAVQKLAELESVAVRFAGDSGDGSQLVGLQFTNTLTKYTRVEEGLHLMLFRVLDTQMIGGIGILFSIKRLNRVVIGVRARDPLISNSC